MALQKLGSVNYTASGVFNLLGQWAMVINFYGINIKQF